MGVQVDLLFGSAQPEDTGKVGTYLGFLRGPLKLLRHTSLTSVPFSMKVRRGEYDIVHSHTPESALDAMLSGIIPASRLLVHLHGHDRLVYSEWQQEVAGGRLPYDFMTDFYLNASIAKARRVFSVCENFAAVSPPVVAETKELYGLAPSLIMNGFSGMARGRQFSAKPEETGSWALRKKLGLEKKKIVLFVGTNAWRKGLHYLLEAMDYLPQDYHLIAVGVNPHSLPAGFPRANATAIPQAPNAALPAYYSLADVFCMPSLYEPFGLVYLEALSHGVPCVGTAGTGAEGIIVPGKSGFLAPKRDAAGIANAVREAAGIKGKVRFDAGRFSWKKSAKKLLSLYDSMVRGQDGRGRKAPK